MYLCVFSCVSELLSVFFSSIFARGYQEVGVMERRETGENEEGEKREREIGR